MDILPTIVAATGATYPVRHNGQPITPLEGTNLLPILRGQHLPDRLLGFDHQGAHALRQGQWKLVWSKRMPQTIEWELYHLADDRCETNNLANRFPERVERMAATWARWARRVGVDYAAPRGKPRNAAAAGSPPTERASPATRRKSDPVADAATIRRELAAHDRALYIKSGWIRDPYIVRAAGHYYLLWQNTMVAPLTKDLSQFAAEPVRIDPAGSRPGPDESQTFGG
jgi:hypothetical protein